MAAWVLVLFGCGDSTDATDPVLSAGDYPAGPFGTGAGDTVGNLDFLQSNGERLTFGSIHADVDKDVMVVVTGAGWCTSCRELHQKMQTLHEGDPGLFIALALYQDEQFQTPGAELAAFWAERYALSYAVLADDRGHMQTHFDPLSTSQVMVIDTADMTLAGLLPYWEDDAVAGLVDAVREN